MATRTSLRSFPAASALLTSFLLAPAARAVDPKVDIPMAIAPGTSMVRITGDPGAPYVLYFSLVEELTPIGNGIVLQIFPAREFATDFLIEGTLDGKGQGCFEFESSAELAGHRISFQAVTLGSTPKASNLCRATFQSHNTFAEAVGTNAVFSILGDLFSTASGNLVAIGGAGPVVQAYEPCLQAALPVAAMSQGGFPLSTRTALVDGRILVAGGLAISAPRTANGAPTVASTNQAFLFDPATGTTTPTTGSMVAARAGAAAARLMNGKILVVGGLGAFDLADPLSLLSAVLASSEIFDPATGLFTAGPSMLEGKAFHTATLLDDGRVLAAGGLASAFGVPFISNTGYLFAATGTTISPLPKLFAGPRLLHSATKLADGHVLLTGGLAADLTAVITSGDLTSLAFTTLATTARFNPAGITGGSFAVGPVMLASRALQTAPLLPSGQLLVAGGISGVLSIGSILSGDPTGVLLPSALASSEILTGAAFAAGPSMANARAGASVAESNMDGRFVVFGGGPLTVELYQP